MGKKVNCMRCAFYFVTWDVRNPKGCKFYGFKTVKMPSTVVFESSGEECRNYEEK